MSTDGTVDNPRGRYPIERALVITPVTILCGIVILYSILAFLFVLATS